MLLILFNHDNAVQRVCLHVFNVGTASALISCILGEHPGANSFTHSFRYGDGLLLIQILHHPSEVCNDALWAGNWVSTWWCWKTMQLCAVHGHGNKDSDSYVYLNAYKHVKNVNCKITRSFSFAVCVSLLRCIFRPTPVHRICTLCLDHCFMVSTWFTAMALKNGIQKNPARALLLI